MTLGEKIRHLRAVEGSLRGIGRAMTQAEVVREMKRELRKTISQSYLSQIESGARPHMTHGTRELLARFFKVHPGFLVDDAEGFQTNLGSELRIEDAKMDSWLYAAAENFRGLLQCLAQPVNARQLKTRVAPPGVHLRRAIFR